MHLIVRADAGHPIGSGHVTRCLALALAWQARGGTVTFVSGNLDDGFHRTLAAHRIDVAATLDPGPGAWVALDGYQFDADYQRAIRAKGACLLVIDDTVRLPHYHADLLLNQNLGAEHQTYKSDEDTVQLLGARYVLLRPEFRCLNYREFPSKARRILISLGGSDADNVTEKVMRALPEVEATVVVGASNPHWDALRAVAGPSFSLVRGISDMADRMREADLAITAGGSTCWEACSLGLPSVLIVIAENQTDIARALHEAGAVFSLGTDPPLEVMRETVGKLVADAERRKAMSEKGQALIDGGGADRVVEAMLARTKCASYI